MYNRLYPEAYRIRPPEDTLDIIRPHLGEFGITRCADLTGFDVLGIPVCCAFNPANPVLQMSWGKGAGLADARASACMEAIERYHVNFPMSREVNASLCDMISQGHTVVRPQNLQRFNESIDLSEDMPVRWLPMEALGREKGGEQVYVPAPAVYPCEPRVNLFCANGLASGNCLEEAQLHALYEFIERNAISSCFDAAGRLKIRKNGTVRMDMATCRAEPVQMLFENIRQAGLDLVLLKPDSLVEGVHAFWAALINPDADLPWIRVNIGYGAHGSPVVAAVRSITEAAQSRLAYLHGCREDMGHKMRYPRTNAVNKVLRYFASFKPEQPWSGLENSSRSDPVGELARVMDATAAAGFTRIYRLQIPCRIKDIAVVKLIVEGMQYRHGLF